MLEPMLQCPVGVVYDDDAHTYLLDGAPVPAVSSIINVVEPDQYACVAEDVLMRAAVRGSNRHHMVALDVRDNLNLDALDDDMLSDYLAWNEFCALFCPEVTHSERVVCSRLRKYCGTLDLIAKLTYKGTRDTWIIDLKFTAQMSWLVDIQTMAYKIAAVESIPGLDPNSRRACLWIRNGRFKFIEMKNPSDQAVFIAGRTIFNRREQK